MGESCAEAVSEELGRIGGQWFWHQEGQGTKPAPPWAPLHLARTDSVHGLAATLGIPTSPGVEFIIPWPYYLNAA